MAGKRKKREVFLRLISEEQLYFSAAAAEGLGPRVDLWERDGIMALVSRPEGRFHLGAKRLSSTALVAYLREKFHCDLGARLTAWWEPSGRDGVLLFGKTAWAGSGFGPGYTPVELPYVPLGEFYLQNSERWSYYLSTEAARLLGGKCAVYASGRWLALKGEESGCLRVSRSAPGQKHVLSSKELKLLLRRQFPGVDRLWLVPHGKLLLVSDRKHPRESALPPVDAFRRLALTHRNQEMLWGRLWQDRLSMTKKLSAHMGARVSLYETEDAVLLLNDPEGEYRIVEGTTRMILSTGLVRYLREKFGCALQEALPGCLLPNGAALLAPGAEAAVVALEGLQPIRGPFQRKRRGSAEGAAYGQEAAKMLYQLPAGWGPGHVSQREGGGVAERERGAL